MQRLGFIRSGILDRVFLEDLRQRDPVWAYAAVSVCALIVGIFRIGPWNFATSLWAEDGGVFLSDAYRDGFFANLLSPYAGYAHSVPRVLIFFSSVGNPAYAPLLVNGAATISVAALSAFVFRATRAAIPNLPVRLGFALYVGAQPIASEVLVSLANLQWYLLFSAIVGLLCTASSWRMVAVCSAICVLAATSSPFGFFLIPLAALRVIWKSAVRTWVPFAFLVAGCVVQFMVILHAPERGLLPVTSPPKLGAWFVSHVVAPTIFGERLSGVVTSVWSLSLGVLGLGLVMMLIFLRKSSRYRAWPLLLVVGSYCLGLYVALTAASGVAPPRYATPSGLLLALMIAVLLAGIFSKDEDDVVGAGVALSGRRMVATGVVVIIVAGWALALPAQRESDSSWSDSLSQAKVLCDGLRVEYVSVPISPRGWTAEVPCDRLES